MHKPHTHTHSTEHVKTKNSKYYPKYCLFFFSIKKRYRYAYTPVKNLRVTTSTDLSYCIGAQPTRHKDTTPTAETYQTVGRHEERHTTHNNARLVPFQSSISLGCCNQLETQHYADCCGLWEIWTWVPGNGDFLRVQGLSGCRALAWATGGTWS